MCSYGADEIADMVQRLRAGETVTVPGLSEAQLDDIGDAVDVLPERTVMYTYATSELRVVDFPRQVREALSRAAAGPRVLRSRRNRFITESSAEFADADADEVAELLAEAKTAAPRPRT